MEWNGMNGTNEQLFFIAGTKVGPISIYM